MTRTDKFGWFSQQLKLNEYNPLEWDTTYELKRMGANKNTVMVSGFGQGGNMASSMHVIYSKDIQGCGIISGSSFPGFLPYYKDDNEQSLIKEGSDIVERNQTQKIWYEGWNKDHVIKALQTMTDAELIDDYNEL